MINTINTPLLSIIIPIFNRQKYLDLLLYDLSDMILSGGFNKEVEVIVVDDGSDQPIQANIDNLSVKLYHLQVNSGAPIAREKGFQASSGQFIHFHDSDDSFANDWLKKMMEELSLHPQRDVLLTARYICDESENKYHFQKFVSRHADKIPTIKNSLIYQNCIGPLSGVTFSRRVLEPIEFKRFVACQDWQMYIEAITHAKSMGSYKDITFRYNISNDDRISKKPRKIVLGHLQISQITAKQSIFGRNIRLYYLGQCEQNIFAIEGQILRFYQQHRFKIKFYYLLVMLHHNVVIKYLGVLFFKRKGK